MKLPLIKDYPKTLTLGGEIYTIRFVKCIGKDKETYGQCDPEKLEILIRRGLGREETFKTFIHEIIHGLVEFESDIELKHKHVYKLETAIYEFLFQNF